jgi:hypothetical protein
VPFRALAQGPLRLMDSLTTLEAAVGGVVDRVTKMVGSRHLPCRATDHDRLHGEALRPKASSARSSETSSNASRATNGAPPRRPRRRVRSAGADRGRNHLPANGGLLDVRFERETSRAPYVVLQRTSIDGRQAEHFLCSILRQSRANRGRLASPICQTSANQLSIGSRPQLPRFIVFSQKRMASATHPWALVPVPSPKPWPRFPNL